MPMGFTWAFCLAHNVTINIIKAAYRITQPMRSAANSETKLVFFNRKEVPFHIIHGTAFVLAIIDDVGILFAGWEKRDMIALHTELVRLLTEAGLPIAPDKSLKVGEIEETALPFIGNVIRLDSCTIAPMPKRLSKLNEFVKIYNFSQEVPYTIWASLVGKMVSYAMLYPEYLRNSTISTGTLLNRQPETAPRRQQSKLRSRNIKTGAVSHNISIDKSHGTVQPGDRDPIRGI